MIKKTEILNLPEVVEYLAEDKEKNSELIAFIKKFNSFKPKEAKELKKKLNDLGIIKMREEQVSKIIDIVPDTLIVNSAILPETSGVTVPRP